MLRYLSSSLFLSVIALIGIGLVQVYSSSFIFAIESYGDGLFFFKKQLVFALIAFAALIGAIHIKCNIASGRTCSGRGHSNCSSKSGCLAQVSRTLG